MNKTQKIFLIILPFFISLWLICKSISQENPFFVVLGEILFVVGIVALIVLKER